MTRQECLEVKIALELGLHDQLRIKLLHWCHEDMPSQRCTACMSRGYAITKVHSLYVTRICHHKASQSICHEDMPSQRITVYMSRGYAITKRHCLHVMRIWHQKGAQPVCQGHRGTMLKNKHETSIPNIILLHSKMYRLITIISMTFVESEQSRFKTCTATRYWV